MKGANHKRHMVCDSVHMKCPEIASLEIEGRLVAPNGVGRAGWGISLCSDECVLESENSDHCTAVRIN